MSFVVGQKTSTAKGRVADGEKAATFSHRYIYAEDEKGEPTGNWNPESAVEAFQHYMEATGRNENQVKADMLFLTNRAFYFDDQPGADPVERKLRELSKVTGIDVEVLRLAVEASKK